MPFKKLDEIDDAETTEEKKVGMYQILPIDQTKARIMYIGDKNQEGNVDIFVCKSKFKYGFECVVVACLHDYEIHDEKVWPIIQAHIVTDDDQVLVYLSYNYVTDPEDGEHYNITLHFNENGQDMYSILKPVDWINPETMFDTLVACLLDEKVENLIQTQLDKLEETETETN